MTQPVVMAVHARAEHTFSKDSRPVITLHEGLGVVGDPSQPNLRQVHLIPAELFERLAGAGYPVAPGELGENTQGERRAGRASRRRDGHRVALWRGAAG